jgi:hypothetical protein
VPFGKESYADMILMVKLPIRLKESSVPFGKESYADQTKEKRI